MSDGEAIYTARYAFPEYLQRDREQVLRFPLYLGRSLSAPLSGAYELRDPRGDVLVSQAITVVDQVARTTLTAAQLPSTLDVGYRYRETWMLALNDGTTRPFDRDVVVTLHQIAPVVTDQDMADLYQDLREHLACGNPGFEPKRVEAWKEIIERLEAAGSTPHLFMDAWRLRPVHLHLALTLQFRDFWSCQNIPKWQKLGDHHQRKYEAAWRKLEFRYDKDRDGIDEGHKRASEGVLYTTGVPARSRFRYAYGRVW